MKNLQDYRKESILSKKIRYSEGIMTRKEWLDLKRVQGAVVKETTKNRIQFDRRKFNGMCDHAQQREYERKCDEKIPCYELREKPNDTTYFEITKTEFEYFENAQLSEDIQTEKHDLSERIEAGMATKDEIQAGFDKEMEFFKTYFPA